MRSRSTLRARCSTTPSNVTLVAAIHYLSAVPASCADAWPDEMTAARPMIRANVDNLEVNDGLKRQAADGFHVVRVAGDPDHQRREEQGHDDA